MCCFHRIGFSVVVSFKGDMDRVTISSATSCTAVLSELVMQSLFLSIKKTTPDSSPLPYVVICLKNGVTVPVVSVC